MKAVNMILFIGACVFLLLLVLSDFGLVFPTENIFARVLLHFSAIFLMISSGIQLKKLK